MGSCGCCIAFAVGNKTCNQGWVTYPEKACQTKGKITMGRKHVHAIFHIRLWIIKKTGKEKVGEMEVLAYNFLQPEW